MYTVFTMAIKKYERDMKEFESKEELPKSEQLSQQTISYNSQQNWLYIISSPVYSLQNQLNNSQNRDDFIFFWGDQMFIFMIFLLYNHMYFFLFFTKSPKIIHPFLKLLLCSKNIIGAKFSIRNRDKDGKISGVKMGWKGTCIGNKWRKKTEAGVRRPVNI